MTGDGSDDEFYDAEERELASVSSRRSLSSQLSSRSSYHETSSQPASPSAHVVVPLARVTVNNALLSCERAPHVPSQLTVATACQK